MSKIEQLKQTLAQLLKDRDQAIIKHNKSRISSLDREISQLQNRIKNLEKT